MWMPKEVIDIIAERMHERIGSISENWTNEEMVRMVLAEYREVAARKQTENMVEMRQRVFDAMPLALKLAQRIYDEGNRELPLPMFYDLAGFARVTEGDMQAFRFALEELTTIGPLEKIAHSSYPDHPLYYRWREKEENV